MFWTRYEKPHYLREEDTPLSAKYNTAAIDKMLIDEKPFDELQPSIKGTTTTILQTKIIQILSLHLIYFYTHVFPPV